uniref:Uncharacterized protein n=1 Tax=Myotis myotis TaxID=51298 RepID=A0A7J7VZ12_MYOMY|nr:hypothetical protein mMyoMyo1_012284 [Myotis myotis]
MMRTDHQGFNAGPAAVTWQWQFSGDAPQNQRGGSPIPQGHAISPLAVGYVVAGALLPRICFTAHLCLRSTSCMTATLQSALSHSGTPQGCQRASFSPIPAGQAKGPHLLKGPHRGATPGAAGQGGTLGGWL